MSVENKSIVTNFIEEIWHQQQFDSIEDYIAPNFIDHSLPPTFSANKEGLIRWIVGTGNSFEHQTIIEEMVHEDNKIMLKITMQLKHIGVWRGLKPTHLEISTVGYRYYKLANGKITEHWGLLDGTAIENQLKKSQHGCKIQL